MANFFALDGKDGKTGLSLAPGTPDALVDHIQDAAADTQAARTVALRRDGLVVQSGQSAANCNDPFAGIFVVTTAIALSRLRVVWRNSLKIGSSKPSIRRLKDHALFGDGSNAGAVKTHSGSEGIGTFGFLMEPLQPSQ